MGGRKDNQPSIRPIQLMPSSSPPCFILVTAVVLVSDDFSRAGIPSSRSSAFCASFVLTSFLLGRPAPIGLAPGSRMLTLIFSGRSCPMLNVPMKRCALCSVPGSTVMSHIGAPRWRLWSRKLSRLIVAGECWLVAVFVDDWTFF